MRQLALALLLALFACVAFAEDSGVYFPMEDAKRVLVGLEAGKAAERKLAVCDQAVGVLSAEKAQLSLKVDGLLLDKAALADTGENFRALLEKSEEARGECEGSRPSRLTWFGLGGLSALLAVVLAGFAAR